MYIQLETPAAQALKSLMQNLQLDQPSKDIAPTVLFDRIMTKLKSSSVQDWGQPLFKPSQPLSSEDWSKLENLQRELDAEYDLRRDMLLTRLDVTVQSFQWNNSKEANEKLNSHYLVKRKELDDLVNLHKETGIADLLAARTDLLIIEKTSSELVRRNTQSTVQKHIIGNVPDRGGSLA